MSAAAQTLSAAQESRRSFADGRNPNAIAAEPTATAATSARASAERAMTASACAPARVRRTRARASTAEAASAPPSAAAGTRRPSSEVACHAPATMAKPAAAALQRASRQRAASAMAHTAAAPSSSAPLTSMEKPPRKASSAVASAPQPRRGWASARSPGCGKGSGVRSGRGPFHARERLRKAKLAARAPAGSAAQRTSLEGQDRKTVGPKSDSASPRRQRPALEARRPTAPLPSTTAPAPQRTANKASPRRQESPLEKRSAASAAPAARSDQCTSAEAPSRSPPRCRNGNEASMSATPARASAVTGAREARSSARARAPNKAAAPLHAVHCRGARRCQVASSVAERARTSAGPRRLPAAAALNEPVAASRSKTAADRPAAEPSRGELQISRLASRQRDPRERCRERGHHGRIDLRPRAPACAQLDVHAQGGEGREHGERTVEGWNRKRRATERVRATEDEEERVGERGEVEREHAGGRRLGAAQRRGGGKVEHRPSHVRQQEHGGRRERGHSRPEDHQGEQRDERAREWSRQRPVEKARREVQQRIRDDQDGGARDRPCPDAQLESARGRERGYRHQGKPDVGHRAAGRVEAVVALQPERDADEPARVRERGSDDEHLPAELREGAPRLAQEVERAATTRNPPMN